VTSAGLHAVLLPIEDSADTAAAEQQLMVRTIVEQKRHVILDSETQVWPERLLVPTPRL